MGETPMPLNMASKTYILCPGQGAQTVGMGKSIVETSDVARETFDTANRVLGFDLTSLCFGGPEDRLNQTDVSQPAIYVTSVASFRAARGSGRWSSRPFVTAGLARLWRPRR